MICFEIVLVYYVVFVVVLFIDIELGGVVVM